MGYSFTEFDKVICGCVRRLSRGAVSMEGFDHHHDNNPHQQDDGKLVEPSEKNVIAPVAVVAEHLEVKAAGDMVTDQYQYQRRLDMKPDGAEIIAGCGSHQAKTKKQRQHHGGRADAPVQLALHDLEALDTHRVLRHGVIDEQPR